MNYDHHYADLLDAEQPRYHGTPWTERQDEQLTHMFMKGNAMRFIAERLGRTEYAIECRLKMHGLDPATRTNVNTTNPMKGTDVKLTHMLTLLQKDYTTCKVAIHKVDGKPMTYKVPLSMGLQVGDRVVVYLNEMLTTGVVSAVDEEPDIDFSAPYAFKWVVQKIDLTTYDEQVAREAAALAHMTKLDRARKLREAANLLFGSQEGIDELREMLNAPKAQ